MCCARREGFLGKRVLHFVKREILKVLQAATVYIIYTERERVFDDDENDE